MPTKYCLLIVAGVCVAVGCGQPTAPPERYLAPAHNLESPAVAAAADTVRVRFAYTLRDCGNVESIEIRQTFTGLEFSVWARPARADIACLGLVAPAAKIDFLLLPYSRAARFAVVVRQEETDLVRTILQP